MKNKIFAGLLAVAIAVSFTACGSRKESTDADKSTSTEESADATHIYVLTASEAITFS